MLKINERWISVGNWYSKVRNRLREKRQIRISNQTLGKTTIVGKQMKQHEDRSATKTITNKHRNELYYCHIPDLVQEIWRKNYGSNQILWLATPPGVEVIKFSSVLGARKSCSRLEIKHFDWLDLEYEYKKNDSKVFRLQGLLIWQCKLISLKWQHCFNGIQYKQTHDLSAERNAQKNNIKVVTSKPQKNNEHLSITTAYDKRNSDVYLWQINSNSRFFTFV